MTLPKCLWALSAASATHIPYKICVMVGDYAEWYYLIWKSTVFRHSLSKQRATRSQNCLVAPAMSSEHMWSPRVVHLLVHHALSKINSIPMWNYRNWAFRAPLATNKYAAHDCHMLSSPFFVARTLDEISILLLSRYCP